MQAKSAEQLLYPRRVGAVALVGGSPGKESRVRRGTEHGLFLAFASSSTSCVLSRLSCVSHFRTSPRPCQNHAHLLRGSSSVATQSSSKDSLSDGGAVIRKGSSSVPPRPAAARVQPHHVLPPDTTLLRCLAHHTVVTGGDCLSGLAPATRSGAGELHMRLHVGLPVRPYEHTFR